jgi:hypothetical protein
LKRLRVLIPHTQQPAERGLKLPKGQRGRFRRRLGRNAVLSCGRGRDRDGSFGREGGNRLSRRDRRGIGGVCSHRSRGGSRLFSACRRSVACIVRGPADGFQLIQQGTEGRRLLVLRQVVVGGQPILHSLEQIFRNRFVSGVLAPSGREAVKAALDALIQIPHIRFVAKHFYQGFDYGNRQVLLPLGGIYFPVIRKRFLKKSIDPTINELKPRSNKGQKK